MPDVNAGAEPSAAQPVQFDSWDDKGNPIVSKKTETTPEKQESAPADAPKVENSEAKAESAAEAEAANKKSQESRRKPDAEERISQLIAERNAEKSERLKLEERVRNLESAPKPASEQKPPEKPQQPQSYAEWRKSFKPNDWIQNWAKDNAGATLEDAMAACADYQMDVRDAYRQAEEQWRQAAEGVQKMLSATLEKYPDGEPKIRQAAEELKSAPAFVQRFINDSDVFTDLLYALSGQATMTKVLETAKTNPSKVLRTLRDIELDVEKAIAKPETKAPEEKKDTPVETKPRAPKPPSEVGGRGTASEAPDMAAVRAGDFKTAEAEWNRRAFASR